MKSSHLIILAMALILVTFEVAWWVISPSESGPRTEGSIAETETIRSEPDVVNVLPGQKATGLPRNPKAEGQVIALVAELLNIPAARISPDTPLMSPQIGADELDLVEIIMMVEDELGVQITDQVFEEALGGDFNASQSGLSVRLLSAVAQVAPSLPEA